MAYTNTISSGTTYSFSYDALGRLTQALQPWVGGSLEYQYQANGWLSSTTTPRGVTTYGYNARGEWSSLLNQWEDPNNFDALTTGSLYASAISGGSATEPIPYGVMGNRLYEACYVPIVHNAVGWIHDGSRTRTFSYDNLNELTGDVSIYDGSASQDYLDVGYNHSYSYDDMGNPNTFDSLGGNEFSSDNQIVGTTSDPFTYDGNGNPTEYSSSVPAKSMLTFDAENRLLSASSKSFAADYDPDDLRTMKQTSQGARFFVYDGDTRMLELDSSGDVKAAYGWGADGLRSQYVAGDEYYLYEYDPEGNLTQTQKQLNTSYYSWNTSIYDAYGGLRNSLADSSGVSNQRCRASASLGSLAATRISTCPIARTRQVSCT